MPSAPVCSGGGLDEPRFLRNRDLVDQAAINAHPVVIVGVGAIGSELAVQLVRLGVTDLTLIDPDTVNEHNLSVQGFGDHELGQLKVDALALRLQQIRHAVEVVARPYAWEPRRGPALPERCVLFTTVDSILTRRRLFEAELVAGRAACLLDARMTAESFEAWCIPRHAPDLLAAYRASLFPPGEAFEEPCTARATIYCATIAAACLAAMLKRWAMRETAGFWHSRFAMNLRTFDFIDAVLQ